MSARVDSPDRNSQVPGKRNRFFDRYGGKRGFARTLQYRTLTLLGRYRRYRQVDWSRVERLVFVCKGNICRSPFAELVARDEGLETVSCGVEASDGAPANQGALEAADRMGYDLSAHRSRKLATEPVGNGDLFVLLEPAHLDALEQHHGQRRNCTLLGLWSRTRNPYIQDPYGTAPACFDRSFRLIEQSVRKIKHEIKKAQRS